MISTQLARIILENKAEDAAILLRMYSIEDQAQFFSIVSELNEQEKAAHIMEKLNSAEAVKILENIVGKGEVCVVGGILFKMSNETTHYISLRMGKDAKAKIIKQYPRSIVLRQFAA